MWYSIAYVREGPKGRKNGAILMHLSLFFLFLFFVFGTIDVFGLIERSGKAAEEAIEMGKGLYEKI